MSQIFLGFLPWILFSALYGKSTEETIIAILVSFLSCIKLDWKQLKKGFILSWGTALFFPIIFFFTIIYPNTWVINNASYIASLSLTFITLFSLIINRPFTLQYAKEMTPKNVWHTPGFIHVNRVLTSIWLLIFIISSATHYLHFYSHTATVVVQQIISIGAILLGIWANTAYPRWYRKRAIDKRNRENPFLNGNFAPIHEENDFVDLPVTGKIPEDLFSGVYMRNGSNPAFPPLSYTYPLDGDGMIHAMYFAHDRIWYRNRYVKTKGLLLEQKLGHAVYGGILFPIAPDEKLIGPNDDPGPIKNGAFIHIIQHAKKYLAMYEGGSAYEMDVNLNTIEEWRPGTAKPLIVGPHTRKDPHNGDLYLINYDLVPPYLQYHRVDKNGVLVTSETIDKPYSTMMHDFVMTKNYLIFFDCPAVLDNNAIENGGDILSWHPELGTRIGIHPKNQAGAETLWLKTSPFFVYHFANAYEEKHDIIIDYAKHQGFSLDVNNPISDIPPQMYRMKINLFEKTIIETPISRFAAEFPTYNLNYTGKPYRYAYAPTNITSDEFHALVKYDLHDQNTYIHDFGNDSRIGEAVFAPKKNAKDEDDGYLMLFVYSKDNNKSDFVILDAKNITANPLARIHLPRRVPNGLHGSWFGEVL